MTALQWYVETARWLLRPRFTFFRGLGRFWRALYADKFALVAFVLFTALVLALVLAPLIAPSDPTTVTSATLVAPGWKHLMGTDEYGRDILSRVLWGGRLTLLAAVAGVGVALAGGVPLGLLAGYSARWTSAVIMRSMDVLLAFPGLLLALIIVTIIGTGLFKVMIAVGVSFIPVFARVVYGSTLAAKRREYVLAARVVGAGAMRIMVREILPNVTSEIVVMASSAMGWAILLAAALSFLGFGVSPPTAEWGADLAAGQDWLTNAWWISTFPGIAITVAILLSNYMGDFLASFLGSRTDTSQRVTAVSERPHSLAARTSVSLPEAGGEA